MFSKFNILASHKPVLKTSIIRTLYKVQPQRIIYISSKKVNIFPGDMNTKAILNNTYVIVHYGTSV